jgi:hypothetical protein
VATGILYSIGPAKRPKYSTGAPNGHYIVAIWRCRIEIVPKARRIHIMSAKEILLDVAEKLPADATISDAIYELEFRQAVQQGLDELDRGEGVPIEQVKAKVAQWAGK